MIDRVGRAILFVLLGLSVNSAVLALPTRFFVDIPLEGAAAANAEIDRQRDHIALSIEDGWLSKQSDILTDIFSQAKGAALRITGVIQFGPTDTVKTEDLIEIKDPANAMNRPLGVRGAIFSDLPADIDRLDVTLTISVTKEPRIAQIIAALNKQRNALPGELFSSPWLGYATAVSALADSLLDTSGENAPLQSEIRFNFRVSISQQYILIVAPSKDNDKVFSQATKADFAYRNGQALYKNKPIDQWSYIVLKLQRADQRTVNRRYLNSKEPWATVIRTQLDTLPSHGAKDLSRLTSLADAVIAALKNLQQFLGEDKSFSNFDRASGLHYYADSSIRSIDAACKTNKIAECPTGELLEYKRRLAGQFGIQAAELDDATFLAYLDTFTFQLFKSGKLPLVPTAQNEDKLPTLTYWKAFNQRQPQIVYQMLAEPLPGPYMEAVSGFNELRTDRGNPCSALYPFAQCMAAIQRKPKPPIVK